MYMVLVEGRDENFQLFGKFQGFLSDIHGFKKFQTI